jgi:hypothetical protein
LTLIDLTFMVTASVNSGDWLVPDDDVERLGMRHTPRRIVEGRSAAA